MAGHDAEPGSGPDRRIVRRPPLLLRDSAGRPILLHTVGWLRTRAMPATQHPSIRTRPQRAAAGTPEEAARQTQAPMCIPSAFEPHHRTTGILPSAPASGSAGVAWLEALRWGGGKRAHGRNSTRQAWGLTWGADRDPPSSWRKVRRPWGRPRSWDRRSRGRCRRASSRPSAAPAPSGGRRRASPRASGAPGRFSDFFLIFRILFCPMSIRFLKLGHHGGAGIAGTVGELVGCRDCQKAHSGEPGCNVRRPRTSSSTPSPRR